MHARRIATALGALVLSLGLAGAAQASLDVDVAYDLSQTTMQFRVNANTVPVCGDPIRPDSNNLIKCDDGSAVLNGQMTVRYDGTSGTGIQAGVATLRSFYLSITNFREDGFQQTGDGTNRYNYYKAFNQDRLDATKIRWQLTQPVQGNYTANGALTGFSSLNLLRTFSMYCIWTAARCNAYFDLSQSTSATRFRADPTGTPIISQGALTGARGGTLPKATAGQTYLMGQVPAISVAPTGTFNGGPAYQGLALKGDGTYTDNGVPYMDFVGREVSRTQVPEPGSLLLLGSGLAGLAALGGTGVVGRRLRRRRRDG